MPFSGKASDEPEADPALFHSAICRCGFGKWMGDRDCGGPVQGNRYIRFSFISAAGETLTSSSDPPFRSTTSSTASATTGAATSTTANPTTGATTFGKRSPTPTAGYSQSHPQSHSSSGDFSACHSSLEKSGTPLGTLHEWISCFLRRWSLYRQSDIEFQTRVEQRPSTAATA